MDTMLEEEAESAEGRAEYPPVGARVLVQCRGFRCAAVLGKDGKWRSSFNQRELPEVLAWMEL